MESHVNLVGADGREVVAVAGWFGRGVEEGGHAVAAAVGMRSDEDDATVRLYVLLGLV